jgi:glycerol-3-phosphate acyltransferase PlsY
MLNDSLLIISSYLLGSLSGALIICPLLGLPDPRTQGSGNPGATNVLRHGGKKAALLTLILDMSKGIIAVLIAKLLTTSSLTLASVALAVFLGHLYPLFFQFRGGKGVATAFGAQVALVWPVGLLALATWLLIALLFRYSSLAALCAATLTPAYMFWFTDEWSYVVMSFTTSTLLIWRHRSNIHHLLTNQEDKISDP